MNTPTITPSTPTLLAFHNDPKVKKTYLDRVSQHEIADEIRQGFGYWKHAADGQLRGCAVGCTIHGSDHFAYERELGVPVAIARLEDTMFERMPAADAKTWPRRFIEAIPVGADLSTVITEFLLWVLVDATDGVIRFARPDGKVAIEKIAALLRRKLAGDAPSATEWREAELLARAAAAEAAAAGRWAAEAGRWAAAEAAAEAGRWAAAEAAAEAGRWAAAEAAAEAGRWAAAEAEAAAAEAGRWAAAEAEAAAAAAAFWRKASEQLLTIIRSREPVRATPARVRGQGKRQAPAARNGKRRA